MTNQHRDEMREAYGCEIRLESIGMTHDVYQVIVPRGQNPIIANASYEAALREARDALMNCEQWRDGTEQQQLADINREKSIVTINNLLGE